MRDDLVFVGRAHELQMAVTAVMAEPPEHLLVTGPGGVGKTTFVSVVGRQQRVVEHFGSRIHLVNAAQVDTARELIRVLFSALGQPTTGSSALPGLIDAFATAPTLLIIDDADIASRPDALAFDELASRLVRVPGLRLVATARGRSDSFSIRWQHIIELPRLDREAARHLLRHSGGAALTDDAVERLLDSVGDLPLSVKLAGKALEAGTDAIGICEKVDAGRSGVAAAGEDSSTPQLYDLLLGRILRGGVNVPDLQPAAAMLVHLPDGLPRELVDALPPERRQAIPELDRRGLVDVGKDDGRVSFRVKLRAGERLGELDARDRRTIETYYMDLVERYGDQIGQRGGAHAFHVLGTESRNIEWALSSAMKGDAAARAVRAVFIFGNFMRNAGQGSPKLLEEASHIARASGDVRMAADCLRRLGDLAQVRFDTATAVDAYESARKLYEQLGHTEGVASCISNRGNLELRHRRWDQATALFQQALAMYRGIGDGRGEALCLERLGDIAHGTSRDALAAEQLNAARTIYERVGELRGQANCLQTLGDIHVDREQWSEATSALRKAQAIHEEIGHLLGVANATFSLGTIELHHERHSEAVALFSEALKAYRTVGNLRGEANCLFEIGESLRKTGRASEARQTYEETIRLYRRSGDLLGEANCIMALGQLAEPEDSDEARRMYGESLPLYQRVNNPFSLGNVYRSLASVETDPDKRRGFLERARSAYSEIDREDLVDEVSRELAALGPQ